MAESRLQNLTEIFNERFFRIPDFQRGFSWQVEQLNDFWEDLLLLKKGRTHYTGLLTIEEVEKKKVESVEKWSEDLWMFDADQSAFYVIDGQQRLTTAIILIRTILTLLKDGDTIHYKTKQEWEKKFLFQKHGLYQSYIFGYERDNPSDQYFRTKILGRGSAASDKFPETLYTYNLLEAKLFFESKVCEMSEIEREEIFTKVVNKLKFNLYEIDNDLDVYVTFETMNNRGKPLSILELLKNRFIYLTTLFSEDDDPEYNQMMLRSEINETWKTVYEYLGKNKDNLLPDDEFLRTHWMIYFKYDRKESNAFSKFLLNKQFSAKNVLAKDGVTKQLRLGDIKEYSDSLRDCIRHWFYINNPIQSNYSEELKEWLLKFQRLGFSSFAPMFLAAMAIGISEEKLIELFKIAEKFTFLIFRVSGRPSNTRNSHFYLMAYELYWGKVTIDDVINDINANIHGGNKQFSWFSSADFQKNCIERFQKGQGFYDWNGIRYFLFEYELYLQNESKGRLKVTWEDFIKRKRESSIEHIYPQKANKRCWTSHYSSYSRNHKYRLLHSLGNLLLLSKSKNAELQNECFDIKRKHKDKHSNYVGYFNGSYSEIEVAEIAKDNLWTPERIMSRGLRMLQFLEDRWGVNLDDKANNVSKSDILGIDFEIK